MLEKYEQYEHFMNNEQYEHFMNKKTEVYMESYTGISIFLLLRKYISKIYCFEIHNISCHRC